MEKFLKYIDDWESAVMQLQQLPSAERRKMCLSEETIEGLRITGTGIIICHAASAATFCRKEEDVFE